MQNIGNPTLLDMSFIYWDRKAESKSIHIPVDFKQDTIYVPKLWLVSLI